jgi:CheY-like chemotaxis protein
MTTSGRPAVLLVEDEELVRLIIADELREAGFEVLEAEDGLRAMEVLRSGETIDLLFTDIRMPGSLTGWDIAEEARSLRPEIAVIYATGFSEEALRIVPGGLFFKKPYRASAIVEAALSLGVSPPA